MAICTHCNTKRGEKMQDINEELQIRACVQKFNAERKFYRRRAELVNWMQAEEQGVVCFAEFMTKLKCNVARYLCSISANAGADINLEKAGNHE
jgi:hypothetical protein